jgi:hypothetical protein
VALPVCGYGQRIAGKKISPIPFRQIDVPYSVFPQDGHCEHVSAEHILRIQSFNAGIIGIIIFSPRQFIL